MQADQLNNLRKFDRKNNDYRHFFNQLPCFITIQDRQFHLLDYNQEFASRFDPKIGDYCFHSYKGRNEKCDNCPVEKTFNDGASHYSEEKGQDKDGNMQYWVVKTAPIFNKKGEVIAAVEMNLDITRSKRLEAELEKSEKKYYAIFNNIPNPVFIIDFDTLQILDCNESALTEYAYEKNTLQKMSFLNLFSPNDRLHYESVIKTSDCLTKIEHFRQDGTPLYVNIRISPSDYPGKKVLVITTSDITDMLEAERQLTHASKMATLGEMATGIAHELNQPLTVMKTASNFFIRKIKKNETIQQSIFEELSRKIDANVDRSTKIINNMRQFARKSKLLLEPINVNCVMEKTVEIFSQQLKVRGIELVWNIEDNLPPVMADVGRLEQVLINLILNARDAIDIFDKQTQAKIEKKITINATCQSSNIIIKVSDTGPGIPESIKNKIFEPFFTTKEVGKGTGLGLSISYGIMKDFGGDIQVNSRQTGGTCFTLSLPIQEKTNES
ncbi:MAG: PAS domain S-box protein [Candidatus Magnetomorum sp.]|nr:PAS domain S-box protein [Candidatus Magnetomorum sp.]